MKYLVSILLTLVLAAPVAKASHIVGGEFSLQHLQDDEYVLTLKVLRDCENGVPWFNEPLYVGMFKKGSNALVNIFRFDRLISSDTLRFVGDNCMDVPDGCTQVGVYQDTFSFPASQYNHPQGYYFSWERCCRNVITKNVDVGQNPQGEVGITLYLEVPPFSTENSTPVFTHSPLTLLCVSNPYTHSYTATDADGDSLVYKLVKPLAGNTDHTRPNDPGSPDYPLIMPGPYQPISWNPGYSMSNIMDGSPALAINEQTGELTVTPTSLGVYQVAILVEEWRGSVKLGEVRRELQFTVSTCLPNVAPQFEVGMEDTTLTAYMGRETCFPIVTSDANTADSMFLSYSGSIFGDTSGNLPAPYARMYVQQGEQYITHQLCWTPTAAHATTDTYQVQLTVKDNGCPIALVNTINLRVKVEESPGVGLGEEEREQQFVAYPVPASGEVTVEFELQESMVVTIELMNLQGQQVQTLLNQRAKAGENRFSVSTKGLASGQYLLLINSESGERLSRKIMVE